LKHLETTSPKSRRLFFDLSSADTVRAVSQKRAELVGCCSCFTRTVSKKISSKLVLEITGFIETHKPLDFNGLYGHILPTLGILWLLLLRNHQRLVAGDFYPPKSEVQLSFWIFLLTALIIGYGWVQTRNVVQVVAP